MSILSDISNAIEELDYDEDEVASTQEDSAPPPPPDDEADECIKEDDVDKHSSEEEEEVVSAAASPKRTHKQVVFATLPQDAGVQACMQLHVKIAECASFDSEDAHEVVACRMALERVNLKKELQTTSDAVRMLSKILDEREAILKTAVEENMLDTESPLFTFFVKKQARLVDMLTALKKGKGGAE